MKCTCRFTDDGPLERCSYHARLHANERRVDETWEKAQADRAFRRFIVKKIGMWILVIVLLFAMYYFDWNGLL